MSTSSFLIYQIQRQLKEQAKKKTRKTKHKPAIETINDIEEEKASREAKSVFVPRVSKIKDYSNLDVSQILHPQNFKALSKKLPSRNSSKTFLQKTKSEENYTIPSDSASIERPKDKLKLLEPIQATIQIESKRVEAEVKRAHEDEIKRMKAAFKRELALLVDNEIKTVEKEHK